MFLDAKSKAQETLDAAAKKAESIVSDALRERKEHEQQLRKLEERLSSKEEGVERRRLEVEQERKGVETKVAEVKRVHERLEELKKEHSTALERVSQLTAEEAKAQLIANVEKK
ncbi:MAG: DUF3552 domain-containing protein [Parcubacteria group bacterium]|nr:DUF3552 domain-containing protein [Parcubacteria group bacterium]